MVSDSRRLGLVRDQRGFTMVEMLIAAGITGAVVGGAIMMATSVQRVYSYELNDAAVQQEARFALDWITRTIAAAGSNPYSVTTSPCPTAATPFKAIQFPAGVDDEIRVHADVNPPNGILTGLTTLTCDESGEDVTIAHDPDAMTITREDAADDGPVPVTDGIFTDLQFTYLNANRATTTNQDAVVYVQVTLTAQSRSRNPFTGDYTTYTYQSEVRVRGR